MTMVEESVDLDAVKAKLLTVPLLRKLLNPTEGLAQREFATTGEMHIEFDFADDWAANVSKETPDLEPVNVSMTVGDDTFLMTKGAILEATSRIQLTKEYVLKTPGKLIADHANYWFTHRKGSLKLLFSQLLGQPPLGLSVTTATLNPFSNVMLLDEALKAIEDFGVPDPENNVWVDSKFRHDLTGTNIRLVLPQVVRTIHGTPWSIGTRIENSVNGLGQPLTTGGYVFNWGGGTGAATVNAEGGTHRRKQKESPADVYAWFRTRVLEGLQGMDTELDQIEALQGIPLEDELTEAATNIFEKFKVPAESRKSIMTRLVNIDDLTAYGVMQAVAVEANRIKLPPKRVHDLLRIGGEIPHILAGRCDSCHRI